jgi:tetratricopeptide (TPR) repeat protein
MKIRYWIILSVVAGLAVWGGVFLAAHSIWPRISQPADPIETGSPAAALMDEARAAEKAKNYQRAIDLYSSGIDNKTIPDAVRRKLLVARAITYEENQQYDRAEADYNATLKIEPLDPDYYAKRGVFLTRRTRYDDALADFAEGARLDPENGVFRFGEGEVYYERGEYKRAIEHFTEAIRLGPAVTMFYAFRAGAYGRLRMYREARADYGKALQIGDWVPDPERTARLHLGRGFASMMLRDNRRALDDFNLVLKVDPHSSDALKWRGWCYQELGKKGLAIADYKASLAIEYDKMAAELLSELETQ